MLKNIENEFVFTKTDMKNTWNINFLLSSRFVIQHTYSIEFSISQSTLKPLFFYIV